MFQALWVKSQALNIFLVCVEILVSQTTPFLVSPRLLRMRMASRLTYLSRTLNMASKGRNRVFVAAVGMTKVSHRCEVPRKR